MTLANRSPRPPSLDFKKLVKLVRPVPHTKKQYIARGLVDALIDISIMAENVGVEEAVKRAREVS